MTSPAHAGHTPVARGARAAPGLRWAVAAPARGGVCTVGKLRRTRRELSQTRRDRCLSCHLVRRGVRRGGGPASVTEVRDPRHPGHRGLRRESDDGPETRDRRRSAARGGARSPPPGGPGRRPAVALP